MQDKALELYVKASNALRSERGQGTIEYVGIVIAICAIVVLVIGAASGLGTQIVNAFQNAIQSVLGG